MGHNRTDEGETWHVTDNLPAGETFDMKKVQLLVQSSVFTHFSSVGAQASPLHSFFCATPLSFHTPKGLSPSMGNSLASCRKSCSCAVSSTSSEGLLLSKIRNEKSVKMELSCTLQSHLKLIWSVIFNVIPSC